MSTALLFVGGGIILFLLIAGAIVTFTSERDVVEDRIESYLEATDELEFGQSEYEEEERTSFITEMLNNLVTGTSFADRISKELGKADLKLKPGEYVALLIGSIIGTRPRSVPQVAIMTSLAPARGQYTSRDMVSTEVFRPTALQYSATNSIPSNCEPDV